jgi:hypothetical protein
MPPPSESYPRLFLRFLRFGLLAWGGPDPHAIRVRVRSGIGPSAEAFASSALPDAPATKPYRLEGQGRPTTAHVQNDGRHGLEAIA